MKKNTLKTLSRLLLFLVFAFDSLFVKAQIPANFGVKGFPDTLKSVLINHLKGINELHEDDAGLYIFNLQNSKETKFKDGIYSFRMIGPHYHGRVFIMSGHELKIFDSIYKMIY